MITREAVVVEARTWIGTPYHHMAGIKGAGVDCGMIIVRIFQELGVVDKGFKPEKYSRQFHLHRDREWYMEYILRWAKEIEGPPKPGDVALWKLGRIYSHGAIVTDWPTVIHALAGEGCVLEDKARLTQPVKFFSLWEDQ